MATRESVREIYPAVQRSRNKNEIYRRPTYSRPSVRMRLLIVAPPRLSHSGIPIGHAQEYGSPIGRSTNRRGQL